jgi:HK97 family phage prohead protease
VIGADLSARNVAPSGPEQRVLDAQFEVRAVPGAAGRALIEGYASTFNQPYTVRDMHGEYSEVVRPGAFTRSLAADPDVPLLLNHEGLPLARTKARTLHLSEDSRGLHVSAQVNRDRGDVRDVLEALADGDISQMSFGFMVDKQQWSNDYTRRELLAVDLKYGDVSVVTHPANPGTSVEALRRSFAALTESASGGMSIALLRRRAQLG